MSPNSSVIRDPWRSLNLFRGIWNLEREILKVSLTALGFSYNFCIDCPMVCDFLIFPVDPVNKALVKKSIANQFLNGLFTSSIYFPRTWTSTSKIGSKFKQYKLNKIYEISVC